MIPRHAAILVAISALQLLSFPRDGIAEPAASPAESLTVRECVARARQRAPEPRIATAERDAATWDSTATFRNRRTALSFQGGATIAPDHFYDPALTNLGDYALKLRADAPLLDGGARNRSRERSALVAGESRILLAQAGRDAGIRAGALAIEWLRLTEAESAQAQSVEWLERLARVIESGVRSGVRGRADALRATLERDAAAAELEVTRRDRATVVRELGRELGNDVASPPVVREEGDAELNPPVESDSLAMLESLGTAPEVRLAELGRTERRLDLEAARRSSALQVNIAADAGLAGTDLTQVVPPSLRLQHPDATLRDRLQRDLGASLSLEFHMPLINRSAANTVSARAAASRAQDLRLSSELEAQRQLGLELLARWRSAATRYEAALDVASRAGEHLLRIESLHAAGSATLLELLDARRALDDAGGRLRDARAETLGARLEVETRR